MGKKKQLLMIDGYNIINDWPELKTLAEEDLEEAREQLIQILGEYAHYGNYDIIVVFDAYRVKGRKTHEEKRLGITIIFTEELMTADHYIEQYLDRHGKERPIRVATSDRLEQEIILARGGTRTSARELYAEINDRLREALRQQRITNMKNEYHLSTADHPWKHILLESMKRKEDRGKC